MNPFSAPLTVEQRLIQTAARNRRPVSGTLELTPLCNLNCEMCYIHLTPGELEQRGRLRPAADWLRLGEELAEAGVLFLLLTGGEPLLYPGFQEVYLGLKKLGMILTVNTNGTLIDEEWANFFAAHKPRRVNITLYGAGEDSYEKLCHGPGGYEKTMRGIRLLKERGVDVKLNGSITKLNLADTQAIYQIARELALTVHKDAYLLPGLRDRQLPYEAQARLTPEAAARAALETRKAEYPEGYAEYCREMLEQIQAPEPAYSHRSDCQAGCSSFAVGWDGAMRPCVSFRESSVNVFETGFESGWARIVEEMEERRVNPKCTRCSLRPLCMTCPAAVHWETGRYDGLSDYLCRYAEEYARLLKGESHD